MNDRWVRCPNCGAPRRQLLNCDYCGTLFNEAHNFSGLVIYADDKPIALEPDESGLALMPVKSRVRRIPQKSSGLTTEWR